MGLHNLDTTRVNDPHLVLTGKEGRDPHVLDRRLAHDVARTELRRIYERFVFLRRVRSTTGRASPAKAAPSSVSNFWLVLGHGASSPGYVFMRYGGLDLRSSSSSAHPEL
jgi:hypothetical protein